MKKDTQIQWKSVDGYDNYSVSNTGLVVNTNTGRTLAFSEDKDGYLSVALSRKGKVKKFRISRLVAKTYIPNPNNYDTVDHINGDKKDNAVKNLQWLSSGDNLEKYWANHRKQVICLESGIIYRSAYRAANELGLSASHIKEVCSKKRKHEKHLHFEYLTEKSVC